jgi:hypothetical protein
VMGGMSHALAYLAGTTSMLLSTLLWLVWGNVTSIIELTSHGLHKRTHVSMNEALALV